jgi:hypothetical protein
MTTQTDTPFIRHGVGRITKTYSAHGPRHNRWCVVSALRCKTFVTVDLGSDGRIWSVGIGMLTEDKPDLLSRPYQSVLWPEYSAYTEACLQPSRSRGGPFFGEQSIYIVVYTCVRCVYSDASCTSCPWGVTLYVVCTLVACPSLYMRVATVTRTTGRRYAFVVGR